MAVICKLLCFQSLCISIVYGLTKLISSDALEQQLWINDLGTIVTPKGTKPDPSKVKAIVEMTPPTDRAGTRHLLGMINFLAAHIQNMSSITTPLLLKADVIFEWRPEQDTALTREKEILSSSTILCYFDPIVVSMIQTNASQSGLGACLLQRRKPII